MSKKKEDTIMDKLDEMHKDIKKLTTETIPDLRERMGKVEVRTTIWSGLAGVIGGALVFFSDKFAGK